jgi:hypothetical protein
MSIINDGPSSEFFSPIPLKGNTQSTDTPTGVSPEMSAAWKDAPSGNSVSWGIPFDIGELIVVSEQPVSVVIQPVQARWLVFLHTSDLRPLDPGKDGFFAATSGYGHLAEHAANYIVIYSDGSEAKTTIRRRHQLGAFQRGWGESCFEAVAHHKPQPLRGAHEQLQTGWGWTQTRVNPADAGPWVNWLWAWQNPSPEKTITALRFEPGIGTVVISAISAGNTLSLPLRWEPRHKACLTLPEADSFQPDLDANGLLKQLQLDMGQVISATPRLIYDNHTWEQIRNNRVPELSTNQVLVEYTAHPDACFHLKNDTTHQVIPLSQVESGTSGVLQPVAPAELDVTLRVVERGSSLPVPVKLHIHGENGEYLAPVDRHRIINPDWFEDFSSDFLHVDNWARRACAHACTYINGETHLKLPPGKVYIEVSKGFEVRPVHRVVEVSADTREILIQLERVLPWRKKGWVTADTHVHFLSPMTAMLEGSAEGVNIINLLASQWGELMTNVGDFDGKNTWGSKEAGGDGEYLVRVGTENRQHVLGHISLLGYEGSIIASMTTGGADESALGDPIEILLSEWAKQCRKQNGVVVMPHFPNPRAEHAAALVNGDVDAIEMTAWDDLYSGIDPYSLSDWYRYLNCGYLVAAVGGTDKMAAVTAVGTIRTYAHIQADQPFTYETWKQAVRRAETFVSYGPLLEFRVNGHPMGDRIQMSASGGTVDVDWQAASVTLPMTRIDLVVNGEIRQSQAVKPGEDQGHWSLKLDKSCWLALLVRGKYADKPEMIAAHTSPVMVTVQGSAMLAAADAVTILDQIEGAMVYLDTVGTRRDERTYKRMRLALESAHRSLHNRMHQNGHYHEHAGHGVNRHHQQ